MLGGSARWSYMPHRGHHSTNSGVIAIIVGTALSCPQAPSIVPGSEGQAAGRSVFEESAKAPIKLV